ncbi:ACP S-malonyltransferase [Nocardia brasiliensis]|uniref:ACP S-malonyltransferase n=1 Tax=Nocardia brasiliensis TaxID=37326 RepID=UPI002458031B|nr:acyltransferase domain-containing protein [Nocardia brasiliensis]
MNSTLCLLFPGQGAYTEEVFTELGALRSEVAAVFDEIDRSLIEIGSTPVSSTFFNGRPPGLAQLVREDPDALQVALYGIAVAVHRILWNDGLRPRLLIGHSMGEIAALVAAGAFDVAQGAKVIAARSEALKPDLGVGGMLALRADVHRIESLSASVPSTEWAVAVENSPDQTIVSGTEQALVALANIATAEEILCTRLASPYPFHSPVLRDSVERFRNRLAQLPSLAPRPMRCAVYSPILEREYTDADDLLDILPTHFTRRVRFHSGLLQAKADGIRDFVESGAKNTLCALVRKHVGGATALPVVIKGKPVHSTLAAVAELAATLPGAA